MSINLLIIYGHPVRDAFSENLLLQYYRGAESAGASIRQLKLRERAYFIIVGSGLSDTH